MTTAGHEAEEVKDVVWTYAGWVVIILICIGAGVFIGYTLWGNAGSLAKAGSAVRRCWRAGSPMPCWSRAIPASR